MALQGKYGDIHRNSSAHPIGSGCTDGDLDTHVWEPISFVFESECIDPTTGRLAWRTPDLHAARVYSICRKCRGYTYEVFDWVGFYLGDPDIRDNPETDPPHVDDLDDQKRTDP